MRVLGNGEKYVTLIGKLIEEEFIILTRGYGFMGGVYHPPFDTLKNCTSIYDMKLNLSS